jgi:hypothetical protein
MTDSQDTSVNDAPDSAELDQDALGMVTGGMVWDPESGKWVLTLKNMTVT